jgi:hypothetical protein
MTLSLPHKAAAPYQNSRVKTPVGWQWAAAVWGFSFLRSW